MLFYLSAGKSLLTRDVDNLLKHVLDALRARYGARKGKEAFIANDNCIRRVIVEKRSRPKNLSKKYGGKLQIRQYRKEPWS